MASVRLLRPVIYSSQVFRPIAHCSRPVFVTTINSVKLAKRSYSQAMGENKKQDNHVVVENGEKVHEKEAWKYRAPYRVHKRNDPNDDFKALYEGNCHCGHVHFELSRDTPLASKLCHCTTCQTQHGMSAASSRSPTMHC
jgi:hypothetical protein